MSIFIRRPVQFSMFRLHCNEAEVAYAHEKKCQAIFCCRMSNSSAAYSGRVSMLQNDLTFTRSRSTLGAFNINLCLDSHISIVLVAVFVCVNGLVLSLRSFHG